MQNLVINGKEYELIDFNRRITNKRETTKGLSFANGYLAISDAYRIYNTKSGEPLIKSRFQDLDLCLRFVEILAKAYREYFEIWDVYPGADLISWCKYSVPDGAEIFEVVEYLKTVDVITMKDIDKGIEIAKERKNRWKIY